MADLLSSRTRHFVLVAHDGRYPQCVVPAADASGRARFFSRGPIDGPVIGGLAALGDGREAAATSSSGSATPAVSGATQVLNLSIGAVNLSLLGLNVRLGSTCNCRRVHRPASVGSTGEQEKIRQRKTKLHN
jgi:hypothetical protein